MNQSHQNLARSWRPKQFAGIIGQLLPVRMLQNSLYTNHFFPVYLLSGQRGCGKTTTARVFAAALNCEKLSEFQKDPKNILPCGSCQSCIMMSQGKHPDFIEMDAASHTGVDNVRSIVDAASFMPLVGKKRVYLIDEAHMLSKAAFNAFLKILEEPPASVLFILATTDPHKIIDTVRSRCFQLFFDPVATDIVANHLKNVCTKEEISHDDAGLQAVVANSEGSVRDALNLLEQVRFSADCVTKKAVLDVLGHVDDEQIERLFGTLLGADAEQLQNILQEINFSSCTPEPLWHALCTIAKDAMWHALGVQAVNLSEQVAQGVKSITPNRTKFVFETFCSYEIPLKKTTKKHLLLEMMFLRLCNSAQSFDTIPTESLPGVAKGYVEHGRTSGAGGMHPNQVKHDQDKTSLRDDGQKLSVQEHSEEKLNPAHPERSVAQSNGWQNFLIAIRGLDDNLLVSIFVAAQFRSYDQETKQVKIAYAQPSTFFDDHRVEKKLAWQPVLEKFFGAGTKLAIEYDATIQKKSSFAKASADKTLKKKTFRQEDERGIIKQKPAHAVDISDKEQWKTTHLLLEHFGGTVRIIEDEK